MEDLAKNWVFFYFWKENNMNTENIGVPLYKWETMTQKQYEGRKRSLEKMKELHKNDPYILSYLVDIERNWEDALRVGAKNKKRSSPRYYYDDISGRGW